MGLSVQKAKLFGSEQLGLGGLLAQTCGQGFFVVVFLTWKSAAIKFTLAPSVCILSPYGSFTVTGEQYGCGGTMCLGSSTLFDFLWPSLSCPLVRPLILHRWA